MYQLRAQNEESFWFDSSLMSIIRCNSFLLPFLSFLSSFSRIHCNTQAYTASLFLPAFSSASAYLCSLFSFLLNSLSIDKLFLRNCSLSLLRISSQLHASLLKLPKRWMSWFLIMRFIIAEFYSFSTGTITPQLSTRKMMISVRYFHFFTYMKCTVTITNVMVSCIWSIAPQN